MEEAEHLRPPLQCNGWPVGGGEQPHKMFLICIKPTLLHVTTLHCLLCFNNDILNSRAKALILKATL